MNPASRFECILDVPVTALDDEDFRVGFHPILLFPFLHVGYVQLDRFRHGLVPFEEIIVGLRVYWLGRGLGWAGQIGTSGIVPPVPQPAVLLLSQRGHILELFLALLDLLPCQVMHPLLSVDLGLLFLLLFGYFLLDRIQLLLLPLANGLGPGLAIGSLFEDLLLSLLVEGELLLHGQFFWGAVVTAGVRRALVYLRGQSAPSIEVLGGTIRY